MLESSSARGATIMHSGNEFMDAGTAFDGVVAERIKVMAQNGNIPEGTPYFNRRVKKVVIQSLDYEEVGSIIHTLDSIEANNPGLALNIKHAALGILERYNSATEEEPIPEKIRYHLLGSVAFQLIADQRLPQSERKFSDRDTLQFFTNQFSFETSSHLAGLLSLYGGLTPEVEKQVKETFGLWSTKDIPHQENEGPEPPLLSHKNTLIDASLEEEIEAEQYLLQNIFERIKNYTEIENAPVNPAVKRFGNIYRPISEADAKAMGWDKVEVVYSPGLRGAWETVPPEAGIACRSLQKELERIDGADYEVAVLKKVYVLSLVSDPKSDSYGKFSIIQHNYDAPQSERYQTRLVTPGVKDIELLWRHIDRATEKELFSAMARSCTLDESIKKLDESIKALESRLREADTPQKARALLVGLEENEPAVALFNSFVQRWMGNSIGAQTWGTAIEWYNHRINAEDEPEFDGLLDLVYTQYIEDEGSKIINEAKNPQADRSKLAERLNQLLKWACSAKLLSDEGKKSFKIRYDELSGKYTTIFGLTWGENNEAGN